MVVCEVSYTENMASDLYFNEESYYSEGIQVTVKTCSTILQPFQFVPEQKKIGRESHEKEAKHINT